MFKIQTNVLTKPVKVTRSAETTLVHSNASAKLVSLSVKGTNVAKVIFADALS